MPMPVPPSTRWGVSIHGSSVVTTTTRTPLSTAALLNVPDAAAPESKSVGWPQVVGIVLGASAFLLIVLMTWAWIKRSQAPDTDTVQRARVAAARIRSAREQAERRAVRTPTSDVPVPPVYEAHERDPEVHDLPQMYQVVAVALSRTSPAPAASGDAHSSATS